MANVLQRIPVGEAKSRAFRKKFGPYILDFGSSVCY